MNVVEFIVQGMHVVVLAVVEEEVDDRDLGEGLLPAGDYREEGFVGGEEHGAFGALDAERGIDFLPVLVLRADWCLWLCW